jgi:hypothetical protein
MRLNSPRPRRACTPPQWQHTRGSALLGWVRDDAEFIARQIDPRAEHETAPEVNATPPDPAPVPQAAATPEGA